MNSTGGDAVEVRRDGITLHVAIWVTLGVALALWALTRATGSRWEWIGVGLGAGIAVGAAFGLRVRVLIDDETVNVVNPFRTSRIAVTDIERIEAGFVWWHWAFVARLVCKDGRHVALWACSGWPVGLLTNTLKTRMLAEHVAALADLEVVQR
ncbi:MAG: PH domain-containing protein [Acidimicrobiia bacterium]|nr:PH domain-containing protein [Acidimicrobiia bacterium]